MTDSPARAAGARWFTRLPSFARFVVVGVVNTAVYYAVYLPVRLVLAYVIAHVIAWTISTAGSFLLNSTWTYGVTPTWRRALIYPLSSVPNLLFTTVGVVFLVQVLGISQAWAPLLAGLAAVPVTFVTARWLLVQAPGVRAQSRRGPRE